MAFTAKNGKTITKGTLGKFAKQVSTGKRSMAEIERSELGDTTGRGKTLARQFAAHQLSWK